MLVFLLLKEIYPPAHNWAIHLLEGGPDGVPLLAGSVLLASNAHLRRPLDILPHACPVVFHRLKTFLITLDLPTGALQSGDLVVDPPRKGHVHIVGLDCFPEVLHPWAQGPQALLH